MGACISKKTKPINSRKSMANIGMRNSLLDRFGATQTKLLLDLYEKHGDQEGLDLKGFLNLMPQITDFPQPIINSVFKIFDIDMRGKITFSNFCVTVSQYLVGHREEKCKFLFKVFDMNSNGFLEAKELTEFKKYIKKVLRQNDAVYSREEVEKTIEQWKKLTLPELVKWAFEYLDFHKALIPFEVIPSPTSEKEIMRELLKEKLVEGEKWYLITTAWLDTWMNYVNFERPEKDYGFEGAQNLESMRSRSILPGQRPVEINNIELQDPYHPLHIREDMTSTENYTAIHSKAWDELFSWYGGGPEFPRTVIKTQGGLELEIYPIVMKIHISQKELRIIVQSRHKTISEVIENISIKKGRLYLVVDDKLIYIPETKTLSGAFGDDKVVKCFFQETVVEEGPLLSTFVENTDEFEYGRGENVEYEEDGQWLTGFIRAVTEDAYEIASSWRLKMVRILKTESYRLRKPRRAVITSSRAVKATGLVNLGNTCYMNAIIQSLNNSPLLANFFANGTYARGLNTKSTQGSQGFVSRSFANLLKNLSVGLHMKVRPYDFFNTFSSIFTLFQGNDQQDAHEFLRILLDSLHEDMNRQEDSQTTKTITLNNPELDAERQASKDHWEKIQGSIGSVISDICGGQTRNRIVCKNCQSSIVIFEMIMDLSLPIPIPTPEITVALFFIPKTLNYCAKYKFRLQKTSQVNDLFLKITKETALEIDELVFYIRKGKLLNKINPRNIFQYLGSEIFMFGVVNSIVELEKKGRKTLKQQRPTDWRNSIQEGELIDVNTGDEWIVGHIKKVKKNDLEITLERGTGEHAVYDRKTPLIAPFRTHTTHGSNILYLIVYHRRIIYKDFEFFGTPLLLSIGNWYTFKDLRWTLENIVYNFSSVARLLDMFKFSILKNDLSCALCNEKNCSGCEIPSTYAYLDTLPDNVLICILWKSFILYKNRVKEIEEVEDISIYKCLEEYGKEETIEFTCAKCSEKSCISKTDIFRLPDLLIVHLKRFRFESNNPIKINNFIDFPTNGLDLSSILARDKKDYEFTQSNSKGNNLYDLFAVVNHSGNVFGGHYTCTCLNESGKKRWLYYDDDQVYELQDDAKEEVVTRNAYILLYKRHRFSSSNIINLYG